MWPLTNQQLGARGYSPRRSWGHLDPGRPDTIHTDPPPYHRYREGHGSRCPVHSNDVEWHSTVWNWFLCDETCDGRTDYWPWIAWRPILDIRVWMRPEERFDRCRISHTGARFSPGIPWDRWTPSRWDGRPVLRSETLCRSSKLAFLVAFLIHTMRWHHFRALSEHFQSTFSNWSANSDFLSKSQNFGFCKVKSQN